MAGNRYQGVILAAGHGSRMGPFGEQIPKPIVPICNKPLLGYQLEHLRQVGIEEVLVVIGHLGHRIIQTLGDGHEFGVRIQYVEQEQRLGLAHAVGQIERYIGGPFLLMLGDIFFQVRGLQSMLDIFESSGAASVLAVKEESNPEAIKKNFSVYLRDDGTVRRVIEKPRHIENNLKGCGLYLFDERIFDAIRRTPRTAMRDEYELTDSIQILIDYDHLVRVAPVVEWDMNLTYVSDLIQCSLHQLRELGKTSLVGRNCQLADGVELVDSVVGDGAAITRPGRFERCVLLPGACADDGLDHTDTVFTDAPQASGRHPTSRTK